jgi:membrane-associated phospholipid phosphatase
VIIACALAWLHLDWGVVAFAASAVVAFTRIVGGVHFPRDVAMGAGIALACGIIGFVIIPS